MSLQATVYKNLQQNNDDNHLFKMPYSRNKTTTENTKLLNNSINRHFIQTPQSFNARPHPLSLLSRFGHEFIFAFFLMFTGALIVSDPNNTPQVSVQALALSWSITQFIVQISAYGIWANSWITIIDSILNLRHTTIQSESLYLFTALTGQISGGIVGVYYANSLRNATPYLPLQAAGITDAGVLGLEFLYSFLNGFLYLKLLRTSPKDDPPIVNTPYAPLAFGAYTYIGIVTISPWTGAGVNLIRNIAPSIVLGVWPSYVGFSILGQFFGYSASTVCFFALYLRHDDNL